MLTGKALKGSFIFIVFLILAGVFVFRKPEITGMVIDGKDASLKENLNLIRNESGIYEWQVKNPGSIKSIKVTGSVSSNGSARVYIEKNGTRYLLFDSAKQLFDVSISVLPEYKSVGQGGKVLVQMTLFNLRGFGSGNVTVKYSVKDAQMNLVAVQEEKVFVETQAKLVRELLLPADIKPGTYTAFVESFSESSPIGAGSDTFEVKSKHDGTLQSKQYYLIGILALLALALALVMLYWISFARRKRKIARMEQKKPSEKLSKLKNEMKALEEAYKSGFISKEAYRKDKERIEERTSKPKS